MALSVIVNKWGYNPSVDGATSEEDVIIEGGDQYWAAEAGALSLTSTSADDTYGGTGCNAIFIAGLDGSYNPVSEKLRMNGVTPVVSKFEYLRVNRMAMVKAGSLLRNVGTIIASDGTGVQAQIGIGRGQTMKATYTLPHGHSHAVLVLLTGQVAEKQAHAAIAQLEFRENGSGWVAKYIYAFSTGSAYALSANGIGLRINPETDVRVRVVDADADNLAILAGFTIISNPDLRYL